MTDNIRIVLAEDHSLVRAGTTLILNGCPRFEVVGEAADGEEALQLINQLKPDVAVLDIRMPKLNGIEVIKRARVTAPETKMLVLTAFDDDDYLLELIKLGATGYVLKTSTPEELCESVLKVHQGEPAIDTTVALKLARLWADGQVPALPSSQTQISRREEQVLVLASKGLHNREIADQLGISARTVDGHFHRIFPKLGVSSRVEAVMYALSHNLLNVRDD